MLGNKIFLQAAYSCPAVETLEGLKLPENWSLFWHQLETLKAVRAPEIDVIYHYGIPGSGKSVAAYLDTLQGGVCALGLYPSQELIEQQKNQLQKCLAQFQAERKVRVSSLSEDDLAIAIEQQDSSHLESRINNSEILLIDPKILDYWYQNQYCSPQTDLNSVWQTLEARFHLFVVDDFYKFNPSQITNIINMMFVLHYTDRPQKFLYLSTTPNPKMIERSKILGWRGKVVNSIADNKYQFPQSQTEVENLKQQGYRQVFPEISLDFVSLESTPRASETWLRENKDFIVSHFSQYPRSKGAIILNSMTIVERLVPFFQELLEPLGLVVAKNTELSTQGSADLVFGTSILGLGEDSSINFLFFESANVGHFIGRLGKLGRQGGDGHNGNSVKFEKVSAYALTPNFFVDHVFYGDAPPLKPNTSYEPATFPTLIRTAYRQVGDWHDYYPRWGAIQSMQIYQQLGSSRNKQKHPGAQKLFQVACEKMFKFSIQDTLNHYQEWYQIPEGNDTILDFNNPISFSHIDTVLGCGLYNHAEKTDARKFKVYDLPEILTNLEVEPTSEEEFKALLEESIGSLRNNLPRSQFKECLAWLEFCDYHEGREDWRFTHLGNLQEMSESNKVQILSGIQIWQPNNHWLMPINQRLKQRTLVGYILHCPVTEIRQKFRLPMHFQVYPISHQTNTSDEVAPYSVAFGQSALWLDAVCCS